jgi:DEAD/DEAH box helicase domain-containing protein
MGILPYHTQWADFFHNLRLVVIDELHTYRGILGSHVANVLRRMKRICQFHGSDPNFVCTSATIANPIDLAQQLLEKNVAIVDSDGSPRGEKHLIVYNPPFANEQLGIRRSAIMETAMLARRLLSSDIQTIIFARARLTTELLLGYLRDTLGTASKTIRGYRGGYLPLERREIETGLRNGKVRAVVTTNALELGVDIGTLDAAVLAGYPGTIASAWQQLGRAGRRADLSLGILVTTGNPIDQYIASHPAYLFESSPEHALINPDNLAILANHLQCAVYELPFSRGEPFGSISNVDNLLGVIAEAGNIHASDSSFRWQASYFPAGSVNLRTAGGNNIVIQDITGDDSVVIGEIDKETAPALVYEGAVYLHEGRQFGIEKLNWEQGIATARQTTVDYYTSALAGTSVQIVEEYDSEISGNTIKSNGRVLITTQTTSYRMVKRYTHEILGYGQINLPPQEYETTAYWMTLTPDLTNSLQEINILLRPNNYGPNWSEQRNKARARDHYRCIQCGVSERPDREHDVHHIMPFREFGYVPGENSAYLEANELDNLSTLCHSCHRAIESSVGTRSALGGLGNLLQNSALLLLMCAPGDIGVLVEQKSAYTQLPTITIFDHAPGGLGLSMKLYDCHDELFVRTYDMLMGCSCEEGCPACIGPVAEISAPVKDLTKSLLQAIVQQ